MIEQNLETNNEQNNGAVLCYFFAGNYDMHDNFRSLTLSIRHYLKELFENLSRRHL